MTLEINEIGITMRVRSDLGSSDAAATDGDETAAPAKTALDRDELVDLCVRRVLQALRTLQER